MLSDPSLQEGVAALLHQSRKTTNRYVSGQLQQPRLLLQLSHLHLCTTHTCLLHRPTTSVRTAQFTPSQTHRHAKFSWIQDPAGH